MNNENQYCCYFHSNDKYTQKLMTNSEFIEKHLKEIIEKARKK